MSRGWGLSRGVGFLSKEGVSFQGNLCSEVSVQGVSVQGSLSRGSLSRGVGLCPRKGVSPGEGSVTKGNGLSPGSLSREEASVHRESVQEVSVWVVFQGSGSLSKRKGSLFRVGVLYSGGSVQGEGVSVHLCPGKGASVQGRGSLSRESLFRGGLSV